MELPFEEASFDAATMGYGLRNVASIPAALRVRVGRAAGRRLQQLGGSAVGRAAPIRRAAPPPPRRSSTACFARAAAWPFWTSTMRRTTRW